MRHEKLKLETIQIALMSPDRHTAMAGVVAARRNPNIVKSTVDKWSESDNVMEQAAALYSDKKLSVPENFLEILRGVSLFSGGDFASLIFSAVCKRKNSLFTTFPLDEYADFYNAKIIFNYVTSNPTSSPMIKKWLRSDKWHYTLAGLYGCLLLPDYIDFDTLYEIFMETSDTDVMEAVLLVLAEKNLSNILWQKLYDKADSVTKRVMVMKHAGFSKRNIVFFPERLTTHEERAALRYLNCQDSFFDYYYKSKNPEIREAMLYYCMGKKDIPQTVIKAGLFSSDPGVREAALELGALNDAFFIRDFEPPEIVYKKCANEVIVSAKIPSGAHIRGCMNQGRASMATIVDIRGGFCGEKVGISMYDHKTMYLVGDSVDVSDFDCSNEECTTGFHFFTDYDTARKFYL